MLNEIKKIKNTIDQKSKELEQLKSQNIVYETKYQQYKAEKDELIKQMIDKGIDVNNIQDVMTNKRNELNSIVDEINKLLYDEKYKVKNENICCNNVADIEIPISDDPFEDMDFGDFTL